MMPALGSDPIRFAGAKRPNAVNCPICGRQYGTASISIHVRTCQKRFEDEEKLKPASQRRKLPTNLGAKDYSEEALRSLSNDALAKLNDQVAKQWNEDMLNKCEHCGRTFLPDRLAIHHRSCTAESPARAVTDRVQRGAPGGGATTLGAMLSSPLSGDAYDAPRPLTASGVPAGRRESSQGSGTDHSLALPATGRASIGRPAPFSAKGSSPQQREETQVQGGQQPVGGRQSQTPLPARASSAAPRSSSTGRSVPARTGAPGRPPRRAQAQGQAGRGSDRAGAATTQALEHLLGRVDSLQDAFVSELAELRAEIEAVLFASGNVGQQGEEEGWEGKEGDNY